MGLFKKDYMQLGMREYNKKNFLKALDCFLIEAEKGDINAMLHVAEIYYTGDEGVKNKEKAVVWLKKLAKLGNVYSMEMLGNIYENGELGKADLKQACHYYKQAADAGYEYGMKVEDDIVSIKRVKKDVNGELNCSYRALMLVGDKNGHVGVGLGNAAKIPEAIRKGKEKAINNLIEVPMDENGSVLYDVIGKSDNAEVLLRRSPEKTGIIAEDSARSVLELAGYKNIRAKLLGSNNKQKVVFAIIEGLKRIKERQDFKNNLKSAQEGDAQAMYQVSISYKNGGVVEKNLEESEKWLQMSVEGEDRDAQFLLATRLWYKDNGTLSEKKEAFELYKKSAEQGNMLAIRSCIDICEKHKEITGGDCTEEYWYKKGADFGDSTLKLIYAMEICTDPKLEFRYMKEAAEAGEKTAFWFLAYFYYIGRGTSKNYNEAKRWYLKAKEAKDPLFLLEYNEDKEKLDKMFGV